MGWLRRIEAIMKVNTSSRVYAGESVRLTCNAGIRDVVTADAQDRLSFLFRPRACMSIISLVLPSRGNNDGRSTVDIRSGMANVSIRDSNMAFSEERHRI